MCKSLQKYSLSPYHRPKTTERIVLQQRDGTQTLKRCWDRDRRGSEGCAGRKSVIGVLGYWIGSSARSLLNFVKPLSASGGCGGRQSRPPRSTADCNWLCAQPKNRPLLKSSPSHPFDAHYVVNYSFVLLVLVKFLVFPVLSGLRNGSNPFAVQIIPNFFPREAREREICGLPSSSR